MLPPTSYRVCLLQVLGHAPDEPGRRVGVGVDLFDRSEEVGHPRIPDGIPHGGDVHLGDVPVCAHDVRALKLRLPRSVAANRRRHASDGAGTALCYARRSSEPSAPRIGTVTKKFTATIAQQRPQAAMNYYDSASIARQLGLVG